MVAKRIGWLDFDAANTDDPVFVMWPDALDLTPAEVEGKLTEGYDTALDMAPPTLIIDPAPAALGKLQRAQVLGARYHWARAQAGDGSDYGGAEGYAMADMSRKLYLDMRTLLRPRSFAGVY